MATAWNGVLILAPLRADSSDGAITSDASGGWGCSAFHGPVPKSSSKFNGTRMRPHFTSQWKNFYQLLFGARSGWVLLFIFPDPTCHSIYSRHGSPTIFLRSISCIVQSVQQLTISCLSAVSYTSTVATCLPCLHTLHTHHDLSLQAYNQLTTSYFYPESLKPTILSNISTIKHSPSLPTVPSLQTYLSQPQTPPFAPPAATSPCVSQYLKIKLPRNIFDSSIINKQSLADQDQIISTYHKYQTPQKVPSLAQKLAFKSYFRANVLRQCTVMGVTEYLALPTDTLTIWSNNFLPLCSGRTKNSLSLGGHLVQRLMANYANN